MRVLAVGGPVGAATVRVGRAVAETRSRASSRRRFCRRWALRAVCSWIADTRSQTTEPTRARTAMPTLSHLRTWATDEDEGDRDGDEGREEEDPSRTAHRHLSGAPVRDQLDERNRVRGRERVLAPVTSAQRRADAGVLHDDLGPAVRGRPLRIAGECRRLGEHRGRQRGAAFEDAHRLAELVDGPGGREVLAATDPVLDQVGNPDRHDDEEDQAAGLHGSDGRRCRRVDLVPITVCR